MGRILFFTLLLSQSLLAQDGKASQGRVLAINAGLGAVTAGLGRVLHGDAPWTAMARGAAGGGIVFAGKSLVGRTKPGAIAGRQIAALGSSEIRNAALGDRVLNELVVPYGPVRIYLKRGEWKPRTRIDLSTVATATYFLVDKGGARLDLRRSLLYGVLVVDYSEQAGDLASAGTILINPFNANWLAWNRAKGHELVHVLQSDFLATAINEPVEGWVLSAIPGGRTIHRYVDLGVYNLPWAALNHEIEVTHRPWEREAYIITRGYSHP